jgi:hypothetical protein
MNRPLRGLLVTAVFVAATALMLRPWLGSIGDDMPQNLGDSVLITWIMHWGVHALTTDPIHYFHGNVFWPAGNTLAYSDLMLPFVPVYGLFWLLTGNWPLTTNLTLLTMFGLSLGSTYLLARRLSGGLAASVLAALAFTFTGFHLSEWGHLQLHTLGLLPLAVYLVVRFLDERTWWTAAALGVVSASTMLAAVYYGLLWYLALAILFGGYALAKRLRPGRRFVAGSVVVVAISVVLLGPALAKYAAQGERRGYEDYRGLKARDLVTPSINSYVWKSRFTFEEAGYPALQEHGIYPGVTVVALGVTGAVLDRRRRRRRSDEDENDGVDADVRPPDDEAISPDAPLHRALLGVAGAVGLVLAIGPTALGVAMPFRLFHTFVPGFSGIRVYTRLGVLFLLFLAVLAGRGLHAVLGRLGTRPPVLRVAVATVACGLVLLDLAAPMGSTELPDDRATLAVYHRLADLPRAAVVEVPMVDAGVLPAEWAYVEAPRMVYSTIDFLPRVNGYSAKAPETYKPDLDTFNGFPSPQSLHRAYELRVRYVVLHVGAQTDHKTFSEADATARIAALPPSAKAERIGNTWLVDLGPVRPPDR